MSQKNSILNVCLWILAVIVLLSAVASVAENLQLVSVIGSSNAPSVGGDGDSYLPIVTPDGRYVLFASTANNLAPTNSYGTVPDSMPGLNVFVRDLLYGTTTLVSVGSAGNGADQDALPTGISTNGQYAVFESAADNLAFGCTNYVSNVFVRDLVNNVTTLVSVSTNGAGGNGNSFGSAITPNGRYVVFASEASNLIPNDTNGLSDIFVRDLQAGATTLVSTGLTGVSLGPQSGPLFNGSMSPQITPDGRYVVFYSTATNLVPGVQTVGDVYIRDLVAGTTTWASTNARSLFQSLIGAPAVVCCDAAISTNGQFVVFEVCPTNSITQGLILQVNLQTFAATVVSTNAYVPGPLTSLDFENPAMTPDGSSVAFIANGNAATNTAVYLWNSQTGTNILVSADLTSGLPASGYCREPVVNPSGQYVAFVSDATNLTANAGSSGFHIYLWNQQTGSAELVDTDTNGAGVSLASDCAMSDDASLVFFDLALNNSSLIPNDASHHSDVFAFDSSSNSIELVSVCQPALQSQAPDNFTEFYPSCVSTNGRYVAFSSEADDLGANNTNGCREVFVCDLVAGTNILVSVDTNGNPATVESGQPSISGNGRYVAFSSYASNLVEGLIISNTENVYVRDLQSETTALVSANISRGPVASGNGDSFMPTISSDGRFILYYSQATNVAGGLSGPGQGIENLILRDQQLGTNYALTTQTASSAISGIVSASMTPDGRYVVFVGIAKGNSQNYLYVWNSQTASFIYTNTSVNLTNTSISVDGSWIAYATSSFLWAVNLATDTSYQIASVGVFTSHAGLQFSPDDSSLAFVESTNVYLANIQAGTNLLVDRSYNSTSPANGISDSPAFSPDGRFLAYRSTATNIVSADYFAVGNLYLYDRTNNATTLVTVNLAGITTANNWSRQPEFSSDGSTLAFESYASDLGNQDFNEFGAVFALSLPSAGATNSMGTNQDFNAQITGIAAPGQNPATAGPTILWPVTPGSSYRVQYKNNLSDPVWQDVNGNMVFVGNNGQIIDLNPAAAQRFYRIVLNDP